MKDISSSFHIILVLIVVACSQKSNKNVKIDVFENYYEAFKNEPVKKWAYTTDTVKVWFDDKEGTPVLQIKGKKSTGKWAEWDEEMNATSYYDSLWYDEDKEVVRGYFYENNEFYELIGKKPTKTLRTYWFNNENKITDVMIYWIPEENTTTSEHLVPIVSWAQSYDSAIINQIYQNGRIIPSRENAKKWKELLTEYNKQNEE